MKKVTVYPKDGETRVVQRFVIRRTLPPLVDVDDFEKYVSLLPTVTRWFERVTIQQMFSVEKMKWIDNCWADISLSSILGIKREQT